MLSVVLSLMLKEQRTLPDTLENRESLFGRSLCYSPLVDRRTACFFPTLSCAPGPSDEEIPECDSKNIHLLPPDMKGFDLAQKVCLILCLPCYQLCHSGY